jgi:hypothetical protein
MDYDQALADAVKAGYVDEAQARDIPRGRVLKDEALTEIAAHPPESPEALERIRAVPKGFANSKLGKGLMDAIAAGASAAPPEGAVTENKQRRRREPSPAVVDLLKTLPLPSWQVVLGQLLAPVVILTSVQWLLLGIALAGSFGAVTPGNFSFDPWRIPAALALALAGIGLQLVLRLWTRRQFQVPLSFWWLMGAGGLVVGAIGPVSVWRTLSGRGWTWKGRPLA